MQAPHRQWHSWSGQRSARSVRRVMQAVTLKTWWRITSESVQKYRRRDWDPDEASPNSRCWDNPEAGTAGLWAERGGLVHIDWRSADTRALPSTFCDPNPALSGIHLLGDFDNARDERKKPTVILPDRKQSDYRCVMRQLANFPRWRLFVSLWPMHPLCWYGGGVMALPHALDCNSFWTAVTTAGAGGTRVFALLCHMPRLLLSVWILLFAFLLLFVTAGTTWLIQLVKLKSLSWLILLLMLLYCKNWTFITFTTTSAAFK